MVEATEEEIKWVKRAKRLFKETPKGCWFLADGNGLHLMRYKKGSERAETVHGGMDQDYIVDSIRGQEFEGGDW
jgi:hypothetical protein